MTHCSVLNKQNVIFFKKLILMLIIHSIGIRNFWWIYLFLICKFKWWYIVKLCITINSNFSRNKRTLTFNGMYIKNISFRELNISIFKLIFIFWSQILIHFRRWRGYGREFYISIFKSCYLDISRKTVINFTILSWKILKE